MAVPRCPALAAAVPPFWTRADRELSAVNILPVAPAIIDADLFAAPAASRYRVFWGQCPSPIPSQI